MHRTARRAPTMGAGRPSAVVAVAAVAVAAIAASVAAIPQAGAELDINSAWSVTARADALAVEYLNTASPVFGEEPVIYGTPATAASLVDSVGQSNAFAGAPYPGDVMVGMPDNGNGALKGAGAPGLFPTYPFIVRTEYPIRERAVQDQSGNRLQARSDQYLSASDARSGLITGDFLAALQAQASSLASADNDTGELTAVADSRLDAFKLTDALQIGKSTAHAKVVRAPGKEIVRESSFTIGSIVVNGVEMSYGEGGFKLADQPPSQPGDPAPLFKALEAAGITVEILPAKTTDTSIESAGMKISQIADFGAGKQRISFIIGHVSARIEGEAKPAEDDLLGGLVGGETSSDPAGQYGSGADPYAPAAPATSDAFTPTDPTVVPVETVSPVSAGFDSAYTSPATMPDLSIPYPVGGEPVVPPVVEAITPGGAEQAAAAAARPEVRLIKPASVGRSLRDDDYAGLLGVAGIGALLALGLFMVVGRGRQAAATASVLKLPNP